MALKVRAYWHCFMLVLLSVSAGALAQEVSVPSVTTASPGGYANPLKLDTDRYKRAQKAKKVATGNAAPCSADALPAADRRRMEAEYIRRAKADGKASADAWVREEGMRFHRKLVADGICPDPASQPAQTGASAAQARKTDKPLLDKQGKPCKKIRMATRVTPGLGGAAMSMGMVPVCAD